MRLGEDRYDYARGELSEAGAGGDPLALFARWLDDAKAADLVEPSAFCLAIADARGRPSARFLLLRGFDARGFLFYSHTEGRKGRELEANPYGAMAFWWGGLERQIRIEGPVERLGAEESDAYWCSRPPSSRAASAASPQSEAIPDRAGLEAEMRRLEEAYPDGAPRPEGWGGFLLRPETIEFWQGRPSRLHDRLLYSRADEGWTRVRLAP